MTKLPMERVSKTEDCWLWQGHQHNDRGYGRITVAGERWLVHRLAYTEAVGPIPDGYEVDHLCRNTRCVRPSHLEAVPPRVNTLRSDNPPAINARKTVCSRGHALSGSNVYVRPGGRRNCRTCKRSSLREHRARKALLNG
jgi:hypothetical protein